MNEELKFIEINSHDIFVHYHKPQIPNNGIFIFFNPIFEEKKRVQRFQIDLAREFCEKGYDVIRFDYFGTGDSEGESHLFDFEDTLKDVETLINSLVPKNMFNKIILLGIRIGAVIAIDTLVSLSKISHVVLIDPVIVGKRFLLEQRIKRKGFNSLHRISRFEEQICLEEKQYEDFQGYLLSQKALDFLNRLCIERISIKENRVSIFQTESISNRKVLNAFIEHLKPQNSLSFSQVKSPEFWSSLEPTNNQLLINSITRIF